MKTNVFALLPFAVAAVLPLLPPAASAQTGDRAPVHPATADLAFGTSGNFKSTDGTSGTFKQTEILSGLLTGSTTTTVYTRSSDAATRIEMTIDQANADGTHTANTTITDYGASSSFTSSQTLTTLGRGQTVGRGTYLTATGVSGTLTTVETVSPGEVDVTTTVYNSPTAGISTAQRTQTGSGVNLDHSLASVSGNVVGLSLTSPTGTTATGTVNTVAHKTVIKTVTVDASGQATQTIQTLTLSGLGLP